MRIPALEVYRLLPRTNCRKCGEMSCMAFAAKMSSGAVGVEECPALDASARKRLAGLFE